MTAQSMVKIITFLAVAMLQTLGCGEAFAADEGRPWYLGVTPMFTRLSIDSGQLNSIVFPSSMLPPIEGTYEPNEMGIKIYGGLRITPFLAVEAGYARLGTFKFRANESDPCEGLPPNATCVAVVPESATGHVKVSGWSLSAVGTLPIADRLELNGRLGFFRSLVKLEGEYTFPAVIDVTEWNTTPLFGVELRYRLTPQINVTAGGEWMHGLGSAEKTAEIDVNAVCFGVQYHFP